jgi:hypothetical protein
MDRGLPAYKRSTVRASFTSTGQVVRVISEVAGPTDQAARASGALRRSGIVIFD